MENNIIQGSCCGDCAVCTVIGVNDPTPCAMRIILKRVVSLCERIDNLEKNILLSNKECLTGSAPTYVADELNFNIKNDTNQLP